MSSVLVFDSVESTALVNCNGGPIKGNALVVLKKSIDEFLGIPYAVPPLGKLRFARPIPIGIQNGIIDATKPKHSCIQNLALITGNDSMSEDCLTLNIWAPKEIKLKPVMIWIHGGGLSSGSIFDPNFNGSVLATHDIVFVSINYRLGQLGFLYGDDDTAPGNAGLYDQVLGIKWVREYIHLFGGDKSQITIFGQSGGSWAVSALLISPYSKGLFKRAILQSGANMFSKDRSVRNKDDALAYARALAKRQNCTNDKKWLECLRKVDAKQFMPALTELTFPVEGTDFLPLTAQKAFDELKFNKDLDLLAGVTKDDGSGTSLTISSDPFLKKDLTKEDFIKFVNSSNVLFHNLNVKRISKFYLKNVNTNDPNAIRWRIFDFFGDLALKCPTYRFAKRYAERSSQATNVYFYELTHVLVKQMYLGIDLGVYHSADLPFVFGTPLVGPNTTSEENIRFTKEVMKLWTDFAKYGKPDNNWPKLIDTKTHSSVTQIKDLNPNSNKIFKGLFDETCDGFWKHYF